ncbi:MAG: cobalt ECF transporter T component CbiQ [Alicyclobacillaceae bacterium]|nr:cobalt ECF transporter T component CbiQ [Alicyclobacillaceae bacterium]
MLIRKLDSFAYLNRLAHWSPAWKAGLALVALAGCLAGDAPVQTAIGLWMGIWTVGYAGIPFKIYGRLLVMPAAFLAAGAPAFLLHVSAAPLPPGPAGDSLAGWTFFGWQWSVSLKGLEAYGQAVLRAAAAATCLYFLLLTCPVTDLSALLRRLGVPAVLTDLIGWTYRFVFVLLDVSERRYTAMTARGGFPGGWRSLRDAGLLGAHLLQDMIRQQDRVALGLASRNDTGEFRVLARSFRRPERRLVAEAIAGMFVVALWVFWRRIGL